MYLVNWIGERVVADLRSAVYARVIRMDPAFFEVTKTGEVLSRLTTDTTLIQSLSGIGLSILLRSTVSFVGLAGAAAADQPQARAHHLRADSRPCCCPCCCSAGACGACRAIRRIASPTPRASPAKR